MRSKLSEVTYLFTANDFSPPDVILISACTTPPSLLCSGVQLLFNLEANELSSISQQQHRKSYTNFIYFSGPSNVWRGNLFPKHSIRSIKCTNAEKPTQGRERTRRGEYKSPILPSLSDSQRIYNACGILMPSSPERWQFSLQLG